MLDGVPASLNDERNPGPISGTASSEVLSARADESRYGR